VTTVPIDLYVSVMICVMPSGMITNRRTHDFVTNEERDRFPEIPKPTLNWLTGADFLAESCKDKKYEYRSNNLQQHKLRNLPLAPQKLRQLNLRQVYAIPEWQLKVAKVANVMKMIFSTHFLLSANLC